MSYTKRLLFAVVLAVILFSTTALADGVNLKINGVGLGTSYATVIKNFGKPQKIKKVRDPGGSGDCGGDNDPSTELTLTYPALVIILSGQNSLGTQTVERIKMSSASKQMVSGIKMGATQKQVIAKLGKSTFATKTSLGYTNRGGDLGIDFNFTNGKLTSVEWWTATC